MRGRSVNPTISLQIGSRNHAPSAANVFGMFAQKIDAFWAESEIGFWAKSGEF